MRPLETRSLLDMRLQIAKVPLRIDTMGAAAPDTAASAERKVSSPLLAASISAGARSLQNALLPEKREKGPLLVLERI